MDKKVLIGMPTYSGLIPNQTVTSLLQLHKPCPTAFMSLERQRIDKARNAMVKETLDNGFDYLFFVDDDNPIPPDTLEKLMEDDKDIVIAPILGRNPNKEGKYPLCAFYSKKVKADGEEISLYENIEKFKEDGEYLHRIDAGGTGCMLIKREVLEKLWEKHEGLPFEFGETKFKKPIYIKGIEYKKRTMSEDCEFCERATKEGFEIWLDDRIRPVHFSNINVIKYNG